MDNKGKIFSWTLFDFANTSYSIVMVTFLYAVYFKKVVVEEKPIGDLYWSIATSISMIITAIISPIMGAIADHSAGKKRFLLFFTFLCITSTALMYFISRGDILIGIILFIIANVGFESGLVFYDAFLPELTAPKNYGRVSGYGFAMGYLGSLFTLAIAFPFIKNDLIRETFVLAALFFLLFSLPLFIFLKDSRKDVILEKSYLRIGFERVVFTLKHLKQHKDLMYFLIAFFFFIEGVNTVIFFSGNYASSTLHFSMNELIVFFIIVQTTAILGSIIFGIISDTIGQKKALIISLFIWIITILFAFLTSSPDSHIVIIIANLFNVDRNSVVIYSFYVVGLLAGSVMGATQSTSRGLMSKLTPPDRKTEFFGFYSFFGKSSAIVGPLVFGLVSYATGSQRYAILTVCFFFIVGLILLKNVNETAAGKE
ncbi:MAG: MFS transporter [Flavobacterium sp.]|nr:MFS transporter [Flavobacterium sp.]